MLGLGAVLGAVLGVVAVWVALDDSAGAPEFLFGTVVLLCLVALVGLALHARRRAATERARARELASIPAADVARTAVIAERARLAADIQAVVRAATTAMGRSAAEAEREWDTDPAPALHAIQEQGDRAGLELRRLLGLLRAADETPPVPAEAVAVSRVSRADIVLATAVTVLALVELVVGRELFPAGTTIGVLSFVLTAGAAATVVLRRAAPGVGAALCGLLFAAGALTEPLPSGFWVIATPGTLAWASISSRGWRGAAGAAILWAGMATELGLRDPDNLPIVLFMLAAATAGGAVVRISDLRGTAARERADRRETELQAVAEAAVRAERLAVARELHDVVSHAVGVMVMQAGAALATRDTDPVRAARALDLVRRTAADTLVEVDRLVEVIDEGALGVAPAEAVAHEATEIAALAERMRAAGLAVELDVSVRLAGEPAAVVYRVVQETLTNVLRHAPDAAVTVTVRATGDAVAVDVVDDGPGPAGATCPGYGLVGIAERLQRLGGSLSAGPRGDASGFAVHAELPVRVTAG
jgi:signal transduction histidine kinase